MAVYNGEPYLAEAIDGILGQTFGDLELIVVDDGSRDTSVATIRRYDDPRLRLVINERNLGQTPSLNRGLALARGEFVARQDADDVSEPHRLERQVAFLDANPDVALVGSWYLETDERGTPLVERRLPCDPVEVRWAMRFFCPLVHTAAVWRREPVMRMVGAYDERFFSGQDYDYWTRITDHFPVANVPERLVRYRIQPGSLTATFDGVTREFHATAVDGMSRVLGWQTADRLSDVRRFEAMTSLVYGPWRDWSREELTRAVADVAALSDWFCRRFALTPAERARHEQRIVRAVRPTLIRHAARFLRRGPQADALPTLRRALWPL